MSLRLLLGFLVLGFAFYAGGDPEAPGHVNPDDSARAGTNIVSISSRDHFVKQVKKETAELMIVDFWATWCGHCITMGKTIDSTAKNYKNTVFYKVNQDQAEGYPTGTYNHGGIPALYAFKKDSAGDWVRIGFRSGAGDPAPWIKEMQTTQAPVPAKK